MVLKEGLIPIVAKNDNGEEIWEWVENPKEFTNIELKNKLEDLKKENLTLKLKLEEYKKKEKPKPKVSNKK